MRNSRLAAVGAGLGGLAVIAGLCGAGLANAGVIAPTLGFRIFALAALTGPYAVPFGLLGLRTTRAATGLGGRDRAWFGVAAGGVMLLAGLRAGIGVLHIDDLTTDPDDPPAFEYALRDPDTRGRDYAYPAAFAAQQRARYPDLAPIAIVLPPRAAFGAALASAEQLGLDVTLSDQARGVIEARATSRLFRFVDDVSIRVRPGGAGSVIDIRSKSRNGEGDMGANAARMRAFAAAMAAAK